MWSLRYANDLDAEKWKKQKQSPQNIITYLPHLMLIDQNGSKTFCCRKIQNQTLKYSTVNYDVLNLVFYTFFRLKQNSTVGER